MAKLYHIKLSNTKEKLNPQVTVRAAEINALVDCVSLAAAKVDSKAEYFAAADLQEQLEEAISKQPATITGLSDGDFKLLNMGFGLAGSALQGGRPAFWLKLCSLWVQLDKDVYSKQVDAKAVPNKQE